MEAWHTPKLVLRAHPPDQHAQFHLNSRAPSPRVRFPTPIATKSGPMPPHQRFRLNNCNDLQNRRKPSIHLEEKPAVVIGEPSPAFQLTPQDEQLMSENRILRLQPALRLERRGQDGQNETEQPDHSASLGDSITSSTRIRFSVHTRVGSAPNRAFGGDAKCHIRTHLRRADDCREAGTDAHMCPPMPRIATIKARALRKWKTASGSHG